MLARMFELDRGPHWADQMHRHLNRVWTEVSEGTLTTQTIPALDLLESPDSFQILMDVPGVSREEVDLQLDGRRLTVKAHRKKTDPGESKSLVNERGDLRFSRTIVLPSTVDNDAIAATIQDGVLRLNLPKVEKAARRHIEVT